MGNKYWEVRSGSDHLLEAVYLDGVIDGKDGRAAAEGYAAELRSIGVRGVYVAHAIYPETADGA